MTEVVIKSDSKSERKIAHTILREALERERKLLRSALKRTQESLTQFEEQYNMDSDRFISLYQKGQIDDRNDYIDWAGEYQIFQSIRNQLGK